MKASPNLNLQWCGLLIEECIRNGVDQFCVAPGSRSSPLALAVAANPRAKSIVHFDERALAFYALGRARATRRPAAVITTSGTAAANLLPAIVEASLDEVSLLVLTADRPPELRDAGANQTVDQVKLFGAFARWFFDLPCPSTSVPAEMLLTTVDYACRRATNGPVHLNCMFREPLGPQPDGAATERWLRPIAAWRSARTPYTRHEAPETHSSAPLTKLLTSARRGIVVVGALKSPDESAGVARWVEKLGWPVLPDVLSGLRLDAKGKSVAAYADLSLLAPPPERPDVVLHIGGRLVSKRIAEWIKRSAPKRYVLVNASFQRLDSAHGVTDRFALPPSLLPKINGGARKQPWTARSGRIEKMLNQWWTASKTISEPWIARAISKTIPASHALFLGNSMPVRDMNMFGASGAACCGVYANRGASGIDGNLATALGLGAPVTAVLGDLTLLHDLNSLALAKGRSAVIVALNNNGGGIFSFLPVAKAGRAFEKYFAAPHGVAFEAAAEMFGLNYIQPSSPYEFLAAYRAAVESRGPTLIEVRTDRAENLALHRQLQRKAQRVLG